MTIFAAMSVSNPEMDMARAYALHTSRCLFVTGRAGTGKTTLLHSLQQLSHKRMAVVAPTGVAAINAGGATIHSFFQIAPGLFLPGHTMAPAGRHYALSKEKLSVIRALDMLVVDEVSMVRADLLDAVDARLRSLRRCPDKPFGGVQLLLTGDMSQLPPVTTDEEWQLLSQVYATPYFFSALSLREVELVCIELRHVYRQHDEAFIRLLSAVRDGRLTATERAMLASRHKPTFTPAPSEQWITLTTHNARAARINEQHLAALPAPSVAYTAAVKGEFPETSFPTNATLQLKVGAQVMFCKNDPTPAKAYYNGLIGRVVRLTPKSATVETDGRTIEVGIVQWTNVRYTTDPATATIKETIVGTFAQMPLRPAWAITIHKSQGLTFDHAIVDAGRAFSPGQVYVALSRCRSLEGLVLTTPIAPDTLHTDPSLQAFHSYTLTRQPDACSLAADRRQCATQLLCSLFDFKAISMRLRHLLRLVSEYAPYHPEYLQRMSLSATQTDSQLAAVGVRFQQQIHTLAAAAATYEDNTQLHERVRAACTYYLSHTTAILTSLLDAPLPEIDNKRGREQIVTELQALRADVDEKTAIFAASINGFTMDTYWDAKARSHSSLPTSAKGGGKRRLQPQDGKGSTVRRLPGTDESLPSVRGREGRTVYPALLHWRMAVAEERQVMPSQVLPVRTLKAIATAMPRTLDELRAVHGVGASTISNYGSELLNILHSHT